jgi:pimeloyl-ACP methyl ester carboxylesterase
MLDSCAQVPWQEFRVQAGNVNLHGYRTGGSGRPIVLAHGFSDNGLCWTRLARALEGDYDLVMYDARGHGLSDKPEEGYGESDRSADLAGLIKALGLQRPVVIGHSMGAATAALAAADYPDLIGAVVLEDPPWREEPIAGSQWVADRRALLGDNLTRSREFLMEKCRREHPDWDAIELAPWALAKRQLSLRIVAEAPMFRRPWREVAGAVKCPALLVTGDVSRGGLVSPVVGGEAARLATAMRTVVLPAGHNVRREAFQRFLGEVRAFLGSLPA